jgi:hypothetical protein
LQQNKWATSKVISQDGALFPLSPAGRNGRPSQDMDAASAVPVRADRLRKFNVQVTVGGLFIPAALV